MCSLSRPGGLCKPSGALHSVCVLFQVCVCGYYRGFLCVFFPPTGAIKMFTGSPDLSYIMLRKICRTLLTIFEVFQSDKATDSIFLYTPDTAFRCVYDLSTQPDHKVIHHLYQRIIFLPSYHLQAFEEAFYTGFFTIQTDIFGPTVQTPHIRYESLLKMREQR